MNASADQYALSCQRIGQRLMLLIPLSLLSVMHLAFNVYLLPQTIENSMQLLLFFAYIGLHVYQYKSHTVKHPLSLWPTALLIISSLLVLAYSLVMRQGPFGATWPLMQCLFALMLAHQSLRMCIALLERLRKPAIILVASFLLIIGIGTVLLASPAAVQEGAVPLNVEEAFFTATSAVCVTGLIVRNTAEFSTFGQIVVLLLIQIGALGIISFGALFALLIGKQIGIQQQQATREAILADSVKQLAQLITFIIISTLIIELIGAALLALSPLIGGPSVSLFEALFYAVSAFANAGFSPRADSLMSFDRNLYILGIISLLIIIGGIGFPVLYSAWLIFREKTNAQKSDVKSPHLLSLHAKMVLTTTAALLVLGFIFIFPALLNEASSWQNRSSTPNAPDRNMSASFVANSALDAAFLSVTTRTAGFNQQSMQRVDENNAAKLPMMLLMMIGGSPASTAGGMKTAIFALFFFSLLASMRGRPFIEAFKSTLNYRLLRRSLAILIAFVLTHLIATMLICVFEDEALQQGSLAVDQILFEVISAASTVGLSLDITDSLSSPSRWVIIVCMYAGRVGPLALLLFFAQNMNKPAKYSYPKEAILT